MLFEPWYSSRYGPLWAALTVVAGDPDIAREAADEAMVRALERWTRVGAMASPDGWAYRVGVNLLRRRARRTAAERVLFDRPSVAPPPELPASVWEEVRALAPRQREAIALRYILDLPEEDVGLAMGVKTGTASATLAAARKALRTRLLTTGIDVEVK